MPKRWERELQRLSDVPAPLDEIRSRSTHPSTEPVPNNGLPPTRQRVVAGIVAFGVFIAAGTFLVRAIDPTDRDRAVGQPLATPVVQLEGLTGTEWRVTAIDGTQVMQAPARLYGASIAFERGVLSGWSGCNSFGGSYRIDGATFAVDGIGRTEVGPCGGETRMLELLETADTWSSDGWTLSISGPDGSVSADRVGVAPVHVLLVECLPGRAQVLNPTVLMESGGVLAALGPRGYAEQVIFVSEEGSIGALIALRDRPRSTTLPLEPGAWSVRCDSGESDVPPTEIIVLDPQPSERDLDEVSDTLRVSCTAGTEVLTPVVAAQADGVHVVVEAEAAEVPLSFRVLDPSLDSTTRFGGQTRTFEPEPWLIAPGRLEVRCGSAAYAGNTSAPPVAFDVVDPAGHWVGPVLSCAETERSEVVGYDGGATEWFDEQAAIRGILGGVLPEDRVMQPLYGRDRLLRWVIVRDGGVVAVLNYFPVTDVTDPGGGGLGRVSGDVCGSSGITGTVPPRDPDQDGVDLDCRAESQVAFRHRHGYLLPAGESFVRANVPGVRSTDELIPPAEGGGDDQMHGVWKVVREGKTVASIVYPALDGITCRFNAIGAVDSD